MYGAGSEHQKKLEAYFGRRPVENESTDGSLSTAMPLFSPSQTLQPRAVSFMSPPKAKELNEVMFRGSPTSNSSKMNLLNQSALSSSYELFFSPTSHVSSLHENSTSPSPVIAVENKNRATTTSKGSAVTTEWDRYKVDNIVSCQNPGELQQMIAHLQSQGRYPLLVREAQKRLYKVQQSSTCPLIQEEGEEDVDEMMMAVRVTPKSTTAHSLMYSYDEERDAPSPALSSVTKLTQRPPQSHTPMVDRERALQNEINQLNRQIVDLKECLSKDKLEFERQLLDLQQAKEESVFAAQKLKQSLSTSHQTNEQMAHNLHALEAKNREISIKLETELASQETVRQQAAQQEAQLRSRIKELLQQITNLQAMGGKTEELNRLLRCAQTSFENVKRERNTMIETILKCMGKDASKSKISQMTQQDREGTVRALETHSKNSKSAIQAMHEALTKSENERRKMERNSLEIDQRLQNALTEQQRLEEQNLALARQVEQLSKELEQSRQHAVDLLRQAKEESKKEWLKQEAMFKNTIRKLKKQIRGEKDSVSFEVHQEVVQRADHLQKQLDEFKIKERSSDPSNSGANCRALQPIPPPVRIGKTVFRPVTRTIHVPSTRPPSTVTTASSESNEKTSSRNTDQLTKAPPAKGLLKPCIKPRKEAENKENSGRVALPPPPPPPVSKSGKVQTKTVLGNRSTNGHETLRSNTKATVSKTPQKPVGGQLPAGIRVASEERTLRPNFAFKEARTPSKNRTDIIRQNGGLRGMQQKLAHVRSPTFK